MENVFIFFSRENKECWHQIFKQFSTKIKVMASVLYTVGRKATFWNMISSVWAVWAGRAERKKSGFEEFWATFEGVFFNFKWNRRYVLIFKKAKKISRLNKAVESRSISGDKKCEKIFFEGALWISTFSSFQLINVTIT